MEQIEKTRKNANEKENKMNTSVFSRPVRYVNPVVYFFIGVGNAIKKAVIWVLDLIWSMLLSIVAFLVYVGKGILAGTVGVYRFFRHKCHQFYYNNLEGRLSYIFFGASSFANKQYTNGVLFILFEVGYIVLFALFGVPSIGGLANLGSVPTTTVGDGMFEQVIPGDNSIMILIYGLLWVMSIFLFLHIWNRSINSGYFNYRVKRFAIYEKALSERIPFSRYLDEKINLAIHGQLEGYEGRNVKASEFKKIFKDEIDAEVAKSDYKTAISYSKFLISGTISHSYKHYKLVDKENKKHARLEAKLEKYKTNRANALEELKTRNNALLEWYKNEKVDEIVSKFETKRNEYRNKIEQLKVQKEEAVEAYNLKTSQYKQDNEYLMEIYQEKRKLGLEKLEAKYDIQIEETAAKILNDSDLRAKLIEEYADNLDIKIEKHENKTMLGVSKREQSINKHTHKMAEILKRYTPYTETEHTRNNNRYGKFNRYYTDLTEMNNEIKFYQNYYRLVSVFNSSYGKFEEKNEANRKELEDLATSRDEKLAKTSQKFSEIRARKAELTEQLNGYNAEYKARATELKAGLKTNLASTNDPRQIAEYKSKYMYDLAAAKDELVDKTTEVMRLLHDLPTNKMAKALEKEEIKETNYSYKRDKKYLKTNYTAPVYAKEEVVNTLILENNMEYKDAVYYAEKLIVRRSADYVESALDVNLGKSVRFLTKEEVENKIDELTSKRDAYIADNPNKYVGRPRTFAEQTKGLFNENFHITILLLPVLGILLFTIVPLVFSIFVAFTNYSQGHIPPMQLFTWIGWENFMTLFNPSADSIYSALPNALVQTIGWTLIWAVAATFSNYFLGIIVALMINKDGIKLKKLWRTIFILTIAIPQFISLLSIGTLLKDTGAIGQLWYQNFGTRLGFGSNPSTVDIQKLVIVLVNVWVGIPYTILSTTGILMNIPKDLYESAKVDGAGTVTQFIKITLPYILFVTGPYLITQFVGNINNFNVIFFLTGGKPSLEGSALLGLGQTDLLITFLYKIVTSVNNPQYGIASVIGIVVFIICSFFSIVMFNKSGAIQEEDQFQ